MDDSLNQHQNEMNLLIEQLNSEKNNKKMLK